MPHKNALLAAGSDNADRSAAPITAAQWSGNEQAQLPGANHSRPAGIPGAPTGSRSAPGRPPRSRRRPPRSTPLRRLPAVPPPLRAAGPPTRHPERSRPHRIARGLGHESLRGHPRRRPARRSGPPAGQASPVTGHARVRPAFASARRPGPSYRAGSKDVSTRSSVQVAGPGGRMGRCWAAGLPYWSAARPVRRSSVPSASKITPPAARPMPAPARTSRG